VSQVIIHARIVMEKEIIEDGFVYIENGMIQQVGKAEEWVKFKSSHIDPSLVNQVEEIDARGQWLLPGFVDVHCHGGNGADFMDGTREAIDTISTFHARHGTTSMLATTLTAPHDALQQVLEAVSQFQGNGTKHAQVIGVHLEGPFISPLWPGAQDPSHITRVQREWLEAWHARYPSLVRIVTLAPEREGALELIAWLRDQHMVPAGGHTDANYAEMQAAIREGMTHAVHAFNAMRSLHHREPGFVGAILTDDTVSVEVIADGHHVHPAVIKLLVRMKSPDKLILITDAMAATGLGDGTYQLGSVPVTVHQGVARVTDNNNLAGSTLTMIDAFRYLVQIVGAPILDASRYASMNPAKLLSEQHRIGSIAVGKQADLLLLNEELHLQQIWIKGISVR
jgi:N-acetylglucosamine-6-phosphate deacetylase